MARLAGAELKRVVLEGVTSIHQWPLNEPNPGLPSGWSSYEYLVLETRLIGIGAAVTRRPLPHHRAYGSVHGGSSWLR